MPKPMLDTSGADPQTLPADAPPGPPPRNQEAPLASQLPPWDLVPPHTMLVRRRPVKQ